MDIKLSENLPRVTTRCWPGSIMYLVDECFLCSWKATTLEDHRTAQKAFLEIMYSNPLLSQSQLLRVMSMLVVNISKDADPTPSLGNLCQCLFAVTGKKNIFLTFRWNFLISVSACPIASCPIIGHCWEEPSSFCFDPSTGHSYTLIRFLLSLFFSGLNRTTSLCLYSCAKCFEPLNYLGDPSMHLNSCERVPRPGSPGLDTELQMMSSH